MHSTRGSPARCAPAAALAVACAVLAPVAPALAQAGGSGCPAEAPVPSDWALKPSGIGTGGRFRLLFVTSTSRDATSTDIGDYNGFVRGRAATGHPSIRSSADGFRAVAATASVNARDNTCTTGSGVRIYWLNGNRVADDYRDFYDGIWDDATTRTDEHGHRSGTTRIWTGARSDGTADSRYVLGAEAVAFGGLDGSHPLHHPSLVGRNDAANALYGLSPVYRVTSARAGSAIRSTEAEISSDPGSDGTYEAGDPITVRLTMSGPVAVTGRPRLRLDVGGALREAAYAGPIGAATTALDFAYTVRTGDFDSDGVGLCTSGHPGCGRIELDGGTIRAVSDGGAVDLSHPALGAQSGHRVDAALAFTLSPAPTACADEIRVPPDWALKPSGIGAGGKFRLLFVTSSGRDVRSTDISTYNSFVQSSAAGGHSAIRRYSGGFRVVGSTSSVHARDNTCSTWTTSDRGEPIYWLNGAKAADDYGDFYDGSWDSLTLRNQHGNTNGERLIWSGSKYDGTAHSTRHFGASGGVRTGSIDHSEPLGPPPERQDATGAAAQADSTFPFYALSQVFAVTTADEAPRSTKVEITSSPRAGDTYRRDERIAIDVTFSERVVVRGRPRLGLSIRKADGTEGEYEATWDTRRERHETVTTTVMRFIFEAPVGLEDDDGIRLHATALRLDGASLVAATDGHPVSWTFDAGEDGEAIDLGGKVDSTVPRVLTGGVCDRTPRVREAIVHAAGVEYCSQVTASHLAAIRDSDFHVGTGLYYFPIHGLTSIKAGDLAGLSGVTGLSLVGSGIETLPVGLFDGLDSLTWLRIQVGLTHLPRDIFRGLGKVFHVRMEGPGVTGRNPNYIRAGGLPDGIFDPLSQANNHVFFIYGNPGYPAHAFDPRAADAGPDGVLSAGQTVTLGGPGNDGGVWGSSVWYAWLKPQYSHFGEDDNLSDDEREVRNAFLDSVWPSPAHVARPTFTAPVVAQEAVITQRFRIEGTGECIDGSAHELGAEFVVCHYSPVSTAEFLIRALAPQRSNESSEPLDLSGGYGRGETIEIEVTFGDRVLVDTSQGMPTLALAVGTETRRAAYVRGSGTRQLVFAYTVQADDADTDGVEHGDGIALNGGAITSIYGAAAILDFPSDASTVATSHGVDGSRQAPDSTAGICSRTPQVRNKLVELVGANDSSVTSCARVTPAHLGALTGALQIDIPTAALKPGDFAGLGGISTLSLAHLFLLSLPDGVFDGLDETLATLDLSDNSLLFLPARVFEKLTGLTSLDLSSNTGTASFAPTAVAGPGDGLDVVSGGTVLLGVEGSENGYEDPWGKNVTRAWMQASGSGGTLADTSAARASFTAPVTGEDTTQVLRLAVTGRGGEFTGADEVTVRVAAGPKVEHVSFATAPAAAGGPAWTAGARIEAALAFDRAVRVDTTGGAPTLGLTVGTARRTAAYLRGSGTRELVFAYTVATADVDTDGVDVVADSLALGGGTIVGVSDGGAAALGHAALAGGTGRPVNGSGTPMAATGICSRTAAVRDAILARVRAAENDSGLACAAVTPAMLAALSGRVDVSAEVAAHGRMTALGAGDFAWLINVTALDLDRHALRSFPAGVFDDLPELRELSVAYNQTRAADRLRTLPARLFDRLPKLTTLRLAHNDLETLPDGIFAKLPRLATLTLGGNPGSGTFLPVASAGPAQGIDAVAGETVTLGSDADPGGPWGPNLIRFWRQVSGPAVALSAAHTARARFTAPAVLAAAELAFELTATGRGTSATATDRVVVRVAPTAVLASLDLVSEPVVGETYRRGETIAVAATFGAPVTVTGTPALALTVGTATRRAHYVRGSGTRRLVLEYTVASGDRDPDGVAIAANALTAGGATITDAGGAAVALGHAAQAARPGHKVDGSLAGPNGGICTRTPAVRDALLARVRVLTGSLALGCHQVTGAQLGALTGTLHLADRGILTLAAGDFADLGAIEAVDLSGNALAGLPPGVLAGLDATLARLDLSRNALASLPARVFQHLTGLETLDLSGNPGAARFVPIANAGDDITAAAGERVVLGVEGAESGLDDPWGTNVTYSWVGTDGYDGFFPVSFEAGRGPSTARPTFDMPDDYYAERRFRLTVTGKGGAFRATDEVTVRRRSTADPPPALESAVANGATLTLTYDAALATTSPAPDSGKGPVYLASVAAMSTRVTGAEASGRTVTATLAPPVEHGQAIWLSYVPDNAAAATRVQDPAGNEAAAFTGRRVRNATPEGPQVETVAFAGAAATYAIGNEVAVDVTFSEPVTVTGRPTLALEVGAATRLARWKTGQAAGAVQRFAYTVAEGDADTDGIAVAENGLALPAGSTLVASAAGEAVILRHGPVSDMARPVDGVRPTADSARSEGPSVRVVWSEPLDPGAMPAGAGGFTVDIAGTAGPAVTAVAVSGAVVTLSLGTPVALGTTGVTVRYTPASTPIRDTAGNAAVAFASPLAVDVAEDDTAPALAAATVDGDRLTLTYDEPLEVTTPTPSGANAVYAVAVSGGDAFALSDIRSGVGAGNTQVTLTLAPPARAGQTVTVAYTAGNASAPTRVRDLAGNEAASFTASPVTVDNRTGAPTLALSKPQVTEGADASVTLTLATGGTTYAAQRTFAITVESGASAAQTEDWVLSAASVALPAGASEATATLTIVDDARLEGDETVRFKASLAGAETQAVALAIADDDRAVLAVTGPSAPVTEGEAIALSLRLEPHPDNVADVSAVAPDACLADFAVTAVLAVSGDTTALPDGQDLSTAHDFPATSFDDCTREVTVSVPTRAPDGVYAADRGLVFTPAPQSGSDPRIEAGAAREVTVRDDTPGGPRVTDITVSPALPQVGGDDRAPRTREQLQALPDGAVHGRGAALTFTVAFDTAMTVTPDPGSGARPELALDIFGRERRARYTGPVGHPTRTLDFEWTVRRGDYDPDGLEVRGIMPNGATLRDGEGRDASPEAFPARRFASHRVRGGFFSMRMEVADAAREGDVVVVRVVRDGGAEERTAAIVRVTDSWTGEPRVERLAVVLEPEGSDRDEDGDWRSGTAWLTVPADGEASPGRTLAFELATTDLGSGFGSGVTTWYDAEGPVEKTLPVADAGLAADAPRLSVGWADVREAPGAKLVFEVRLRPAAGDEVRVDYATRDGSATAGADYVARRGTLVFAPGELNKQVEVEVLADAHDEGREDMTLVLSNPRGAVIGDGRGAGTIRNRGPLPRAWVGRFGRMVAEQVLEAVESRMRAGPAPGAELVLAGARIEGLGPDAAREDAAREARTRRGELPTVRKPVPAVAQGTCRGDACVARMWGASALGACQGDACVAPTIPITPADNRDVIGRVPYKEVARRMEEEARRRAERLAERLGGETGRGGEGFGRGRTVTSRDLLTGSSFALSAPAARGGHVSLWGRGAAGRFDGREDELTLDGEVESVMLGADWTHDPAARGPDATGRGLAAGGWTAGLVVSHSAGEGEYRGAGPGGRVEAELTGLYPWGRRALSGRLEAWGVLGHATGGLVVTPRLRGADRDGAALRADLDLRMAAAGLRGTLLDGGGDGLSLTGKTDALAVRTASGPGRGADGGRLEPARATVTRLRLALEAARPIEVAVGAVLTPGLEVGLRRDGGDAETGFGLDLGAGLAFSAPARGFEAELRGRDLLSHASSGMRDRGFSGSLAWRQRPESDHGATLTLTRTIGAASSGGAEALFSRATLDGLAADGGEDGGGAQSRRLHLGLGYGFPGAGLPVIGERFVWTPGVGLDLSDTGRTYRFGWTLASRGNPDLSFEAHVEGRRREDAGGEAALEYEAGFRLNVRF